MNTPSIDTAAIIAAASASALGQREVVNLLVAALEVLSQRVAELEARPVGEPEDLAAKIEAAVESLDLDEKFTEFMQHYDLSDNWGFEREVENIIDNADIDGKVERAIEEMDISDAVETALRDADLGEKVEEEVQTAIERAIENLDAVALVRRGMQSILSSEG